MIITDTTIDEVMEMSDKQEKDLINHYKEIEFNDRLDNKITTCITFLTVLGIALIYLWTQIKEYNLCWYTILYLIFCTVNVIMFFICIFMFFGHIQAMTDQHSLSKMSLLKICMY